MKVSVYETCEVSDEQRMQIAAKIDGVEKTRRKATSAEMKVWLWSQGSSWEASLEDPEPYLDEDDISLEDLI